MLHEDVKTLADRLNDLYNRHDIANLSALHAADFRFHSTALPGGVTDKEGWKAMMETLWQTFPDLHNGIQDQFIVGNTVVMRINYRTAHLAPPARDGEAELSAVRISRYENGVVQEEWLEVNEPSILQELAAEAAAATVARANPNSARGAFGGPNWGVG